MTKEHTSVRLRKIMSDRSLRQIDILELCQPYCQKYGIKLGRNDLSQYVSGKVEPGQKKLTVLGMALDVNEAWLMGYDVPMERNKHEDQELLKRDTMIEDIERILNKDHYILECSNYDDDYFIIKTFSGQTIAGFYDYELLPRYNALRKKGKVTADLLIASESSFLKYLESIGYYISRDDLEHDPYIQYDKGAIKIDTNTLNDIRTRIDTYAKTTVDLTILKLYEEDIRKERTRKEHLAQNLLAAAHERTDIQVTNEMRKHDDDIMDDENF